MSIDAYSREQLIKRVQELESEVGEREADLKRFRGELAKANQRLEALIGQLAGELTLTASIQKALVPTELPHIAGFEFSSKFVPSLKVGGDYFDIFEHDDRLRFGVMMSSASGHAMSALLLGVLLRMTSQLEAKRGSEPHQVLQEMLNQMRENLGDADQADIFYSLIDRRSFELRFIRAGSVFALHQNFATGEVQAIGEATAPLTLQYSALKQSESVRLDARDRMVLCTRGVTETRNRDGEEYGLERVTRSFLTGPKRGVHELRNHLLFELNRFAGGALPERDQTLVVLEVKDKVIKLA